MKRKSKKPRVSSGQSQVHKDVGSGSDNESIGDIFTDEINDFTESRNKVTFGPKESDSEEEEAILSLHNDYDEESSDEELGEWSRRLKQIKFQNKLAKNKVKADKPEGSWGNKREDYYGSLQRKMLGVLTDNASILLYNSYKYIKFPSAADEKDDWTLEAKEVEKLQLKLDEDIEEEDFMIPSLAAPSKVPSKVPELTVIQDLTEKEKKEHQDRLHPEAQPLREELNNCMEELEKLKGGKGWRVESRDTCFRLLAANIAFYLHLIESGGDCRAHPVLKRIVQWKKLAKMYQDIPVDLMEASDSESDVEEDVEPQIRRKTDDGEDDMMLNGIDETENKNDLDVQGGSRPITYQIEKNKGATKKSRHNNPRVKHREKFRKAKIRRRGQVREYRPEINKYQGEASGIRAGITKSVRLH